jgi:hypothetical protein
LAYQPTANSTFFSEQTSHQQPVFFSQNNQHQPNEKAGLVSVDEMWDSDSYKICSCDSYEMYFFNL